MKKQGSILLEYVWLALAIFSATMGVSKFMSTSLKESSVFFIIAAIASIMYVIRRTMRKFKQNK